MPDMTDRGADGDNKFIAQQGRNQINAYTSSGEDAADGAVVQTQPRPVAPGSVGNRPVLPGGGFMTPAERPYHGAWRGRFESRSEDVADGGQMARAQTEEGKLISSRADQYSNHGNVGFSGNYPIDWETER